MCRKDVDNIARMGPGEAKKRLVIEFKSILETIYREAGFDNGKFIASQIFQLISSEHEDFREELYSFPKLARIVWLFWHVGINIARWAHRGEPLQKEKLLDVFDKFFKEEVDELDSDFLMRLVMKFDENIPEVVQCAKTLAKEQAHEQSLSLVKLIIRFQNRRKYMKMLLLQKSEIKTQMSETSANQEL